MAQDAKPNLRQRGAAYEALAAEYLVKEGYRIVTSNFRCRSGEIDLIAREGDTLVFVEVKYRADARGGGPFCAVNYGKQRRISRVAAFYLLRMGIPQDQPCRFDVVGITGHEIRLIRNAFPYRP